MGESGSAAADGTSGFVRALIESGVRVVPGAAGWEDAVASIAAKPAVAALEDDAGRTMLLGTTADARAFIAKRCVAAQEGKRAELGGVCACAVVVPVSSGFEAELVYHAMARERTPGAYRKLMARGEAWVVRLDADIEFPEPLAMRIGEAAGYAPERVIGPVAEMWAPRLIEAVIDAFDLCRYPHILKQAPRGLACAYKEMGRCPAPCDGTEALESYRTRVRRAVEVVGRPAAERVAGLTAEIKQAAIEARFEGAAALKKVLERIQALDAAGLRALVTMDRFRNVVVAPAGRRDAARVYGWVGGRLVRVQDTSTKSPEGVEQLVSEVAGGRVALGGAPEEIEGVSVLARWLTKASGKGRVRLVRSGGSDDLGDVKAAIRSLSRAMTKETEEIEETEHEDGGEVTRFLRGG